MRMGEKSRFTLELNEMPNKNDRCATDFVRHFFNFVRVKKLFF